MSWPGADPFYLANPVEADARRTYYNVGYVPYVRIDGLLDGGYAGPWEQMMLDRYAVDSPLSIDFYGEMTSATEGLLTVVITNTSTAAVSGQMRIVLEESGVPYSGKTWNYVMRDFIGYGPEGQTITVNPGSTHFYTKAFTIAGDWVRANMTALAFVQDDATKEICQAGRIFFELDQPELILNGLTVDDTAGGNGNGRLDPGETVSLLCGVGNLNPVTGTMVSGTLTTGDPHVTIIDGTGAWPNVVHNATQQNTADPFVITADSGTAWGFDVALTLVLDANGIPGIKTLAAALPVGGPPDPIGPDAYGYYAYEDLDAYAPSPSYDWVEIDPTLGGAGTLFTLLNQQTRIMTLPFTFKYYGQDFTSISICSNGWIALGLTSDYTSDPVAIPDPEGPPNMIAGFWCDLNPMATGGGKVYTYDDQANGRFIVEFSGVEHYDITGLGLPETFEFILHDPVACPTPTGDGEIIVQYALVNDPSGCAAGIENGPETVGIQYWYYGVANVAGHGLSAGRAVKYTTAIPSTASVHGGPSAAAALLLARPNPVRGTAQIHYSLPEAGEVTLRVFSLEGGLVRTLLHGEAPAGPGVVQWDGRSDRGPVVPAGVYFFRLSGPGVEVERKIVLQR